MWKKWIKVAETIVWCGQNEFASRFQYPLKLLNHGDWMWNMLQDLRTQGNVKSFIRARNVPDIPLDINWTIRIFGKRRTFTGINNHRFLINGIRTKVL